MSMKSRNMMNGMLRRIAMDSGGLMSSLPVGILMTMVGMSSLLHLAMSGNGYQHLDAKSGRDRPLRIWIDEVNVKYYW